MKIRFSTSPWSMATALVLLVLTALMIAQVHSADNQDAISRLMEDPVLGPHLKEILAKATTTTKATTAKSNDNGDTPTANNKIRRNVATEKFFETFNSQKTDSNRKLSTPTCPCDFLQDFQGFFSRLAAMEQSTDTRIPLNQLLIIGIQDIFQLGISRDPGPGEFRKPDRLLLFTLAGTNICSDDIFGQELKEATDEEFQACISDAQKYVDNTQVNDDGNMGMDAEDICKLGVDFNGVTRASTCPCWDGSAKPTLQALAAANRLRQERRKAVEDQSFEISLIFDGPAFSGDIFRVDFFRTVTTEKSYQCLLSDLSEADNLEINESSLTLVTLEQAAKCYDDIIDVVSVSELETVQQSCEARIGDNAPTVSGPTTTAPAPTPGTVGPPPTMQAPAPTPGTIGPPPTMQAPPPTPGGYGDPHFTTWTGGQFDFQGECDLVVVSHPTFMDGTGIHIHGRTKLHGSWSAFSAAAIKIGTDILEVHGEDKGLFNGMDVSIPEVKDGSEYAFPMSIGGYSLTVQKRGLHSSRFIIHLGDGERIFINNFKEFVDVEFEGSRSAEFAGSNGLLGSWDEGTMLGRDGQTVFEDADLFGQEWQVHPSDPQLFHIIDGPQYPTKCNMPQKLNADQRNLRAMSKKVSEEYAKKACAKASPGKMQNCIADVFGSDNLDMAGIYAV